MSIISLLYIAYDGQSATKVRSEPAVVTWSPMNWI